MVSTKKRPAADILNSCWKILGVLRNTEKQLAAARTWASFGVAGRMIACKKLRHARAALNIMQPDFDDLLSNLRTLPQFRDFSAELSSFNSVTDFVFNRGSSETMTAAQYTAAAERLAKLHNRMSRAADILEQTYVG